VKENMGDLKMDPTKALQDAIQTLANSQGCRSLHSNLSKSCYPSFDRSSRRSFNEDDGEVEACVGRERNRKKKQGEEYERERERERDLMRLLSIKE
jgi:hypothetical protein